MIDKKTSYLLFILNDICKDGAFKIIEMADIIDKMPREYEITNESLIEDLKQLQERNYITLKYSDDTVVCLATLSKARLYGEKSAELRKEKRQKINLAVVACVCGACGGFVGAIIGAIVGALL